MTLSTVNKNFYGSRSLTRWFSVALLVGLFISCGPPRESRIVIGSKNFTEQLILGELIAQQIENKTHLPVERRFYLANHVELTEHEGPGGVWFELELADAWVWDMYRPARFVTQVRVVTTKDVNVEHIRPAPFHSFDFLGQVCEVCGKD